MQAVKITRRLDPETLHLPELRPFLGKQVEIIVREGARGFRADEATADCYPLRGSVLSYDDPFAPAVPEDD